MMMNDPITIYDVVVVAAILILFWLVELKFHKKF